MATGRSAKIQEDPEEDYADVEIVSNVKEPKLDLYTCLRTVMVTRNYLTLYILNYAAKPIAIFISNLFLFQQLFLLLLYSHFSRCHRRE